MSRFYEKKVRRLLTDIHEISERQYLKGDYGATDELIVLENAIKEAELTERQAEAIRLVYVEDMTQVEAGKVLGVKQRVISFHADAAVRKIASQYKYGEGANNEGEEGE